MTFIRNAFSMSLIAVLLTSCTPSVDSAVLRDNTVKRIAMPVFMIPRHIKTDPFTFMAQERIYKRGEVATIYIEGDAGVGQKPASSPTPDSPTALRLAAMDKDPNVIWLPQPCQYFIHWKDGKGCPEQYYNDARYSAEVIDSFNAALDNIKKYHNIPSFNLVGYDGGAAIATILASKRDDISSIRTVAGNLDPSVTANINKGTYNQNVSLNPVNFAPKINHIPQRHFLGKDDKITPPIVFNSFSQAMGRSSCINANLVDTAGHDNGWVEKWQTLKAIPVNCDAIPEPTPIYFDPTPLDGDKYKKKN